MAGIQYPCSVVSANSFRYGNEVNINLKDIFYLETLLYFSPRCCGRGGKQKWTAVLSLGTDGRCKADILKNS